MQIKRSATGYRWPSPLGMPLAVCTLVFMAGCGAPISPTITAGSATVETQGIFPLDTLRDRQTVGTARELWPEARQAALLWHPKARFLQLDAAYISFNGRNDHPFGATWSFTFEAPDNPVTLLQVVFDSGQQEPIAREIGNSGAYSDRDIDPEGWRIDSPRALQIANGHGIVWFPVEKMRLSYFSNRLAWQVRSGGDYAALDATTGQVFRPKSLSSL